MREELELDDACDLNDDEYFGKNFEQAMGEMHVLVELPEKPGRGAEDDALRHTAVIHSETRLKRWRGLNEILDKNSNRRINTTDEEDKFTGDCCVQWSDVKRVLDHDEYRQKRVALPDSTSFELLVQYLAYASRAMEGFTNNPDEGKRCHFIAPVLIMLYNNFPDVKLKVNGTVAGSNVHADVNFNFVLARGKTKICVVEAKKDDFSQGKAQALIGCEAVADREGLHVVYGIVTNFLQWEVYRCGEISIKRDCITLGVRKGEQDVASVGGSASPLRVRPEVVHSESLREMCEMIYGVLMDHDEECKKEREGCLL